MSIKIGYFRSPNAHSNTQVHYWNLKGSNQIQRIKDVKQVHSAGHLELADSELNSLQTAGDADLRRCAVVHSIDASGQLTALDCPQLGKICASGSTTLTNCPNIQEIISSGDLCLNGSTVHTNVTHAGAVQINASTISGTLEAKSDSVIVVNSKIDAIVIKPPQSSTYEISFLGFKLCKKHDIDSSTMIELRGKECQIQTIIFEGKSPGTILLKNGAQFSGIVQNGTVKNVSFESR